MVKIDIHHSNNIYFCSYALRYGTQLFPILEVYITIYRHLSSEFDHVHQLDHLHCLTHSRCLLSVLYLSSCLGETDINISHYIYILI